MSSSDEEDKLILPRRERKGIDAYDARIHSSSHIGWSITFTFSSTVKSNLTSVDCFLSATLYAFTVSIWRGRSRFKHFIWPEFSHISSIHLVIFSILSDRICFFFNFLRNSTVIKCLHCLKYRIRLHTCDERRGWIESKIKT